MTENKAFHFPKILRLLTARSYKPVFAKGDRLSGRCLLLLYRENDVNMPRLGLVIAKKHIKLAVQRNRVKRLIRESFRLNQHRLPPCDIVAIARKGLGGQSNEEIRIWLDKQWQRLAKSAS